MNGTPRRSLAVGAALVAVLTASCDRKEVAEYSAKAEVQIERAIPAINDATITARVKGALIAAPDLPGVAIDVDTSANVVTLTGAVASAEQRERAERAAKAVDGVASVNNKLVVKP